MVLLHVLDAHDHVNRVRLRAYARAVQVFPYGCVRDHVHGHGDVRVHGHVHDRVFYPDEDEDVHACAYADVCGCANACVRVYHT